AMTPALHAARWWHPAERGKLLCTLCPRYCLIGEGQAGFCYVRQNRGGQLVSAGYGRSTGFAVDPIEKKPLNHFRPGARVLSFGHLEAVLDTLVWLRRESAVWTEITTLLIPGLNDGDEEIGRECDWILEHLGPDVPLHFTAFHPDFKMMDRPRTPAATLVRARAIARAGGLRYVYVGNVHDAEGQTTWCPGCGAALIVRDWHAIGRYRMDGDR